MTAAVRLPGEPCQHPRRRTLAAGVRSPELALPPLAAAVADAFGTDLSL